MGKRILAKAILALVALCVSVNPVNAVSNLEVLSVSFSGIQASVVQQPPKAYGYVSKEADKITQFGHASYYGTIGLTAHNNLLGREFFNILVGDRVQVVLINGEVKVYRVVEKLQYQALDSRSIYSDFINLADPAGGILTVEQVFNRVYAQQGKLVFQTCIEQYGDPYWGRLFVVAEPEENRNINRNVPKRTSRCFLCSVPQ